MGNASSADKQKQSDAESEKMKKAEEETKTGNESNKRNNHEHEAMSEMTNVGGYSMLYSMASDDGKQNSHEIFEIKKENKEKAQPVENKEAPETYCKKELTPKSKNSIQTRTPTSKQEKIRPVDDINAEETNVGGYTMLYSIAPDDDQPKPPATGETKIKSSPIVETEKTKQLGKSPCKADSMQKSKKSSKTRTPDSKQEKIRPVDDNNAEETNVGGYTMLYSIAPDDDQPKPPTTGETKIKPSPIAETEKTKQLGKSPCKADSMKKSRKSSKSLTPPLKQEKIRPVDDINAEETNVGGYTMLYSIAPDDDQPKPPTTGETKIKPSPIAETEKTKQLGKSPCKADSMKKSRKSSKSLTPPLKQEKIRPVDDINAEETNVGGYTMLYSIAPDDDQPKPPTTGETKIKPSPIAETEKTKQLGKSPCKADSMQKSKKSSKTRTPDSKQEKIRPVDDNNAEETNVGGYTMLYSIAPDDDQPKPPTTGETKIKSSPTVETEKTKQLRKSPCKADSMQKSRKSSKSLTPPLKQEKIRPVDDNNAEETNVGGYTMLYSIAPDDDQPKPPTTGETKIKPSPIAETEKTKQLGKSPFKADSMKKSRKSSKSLTPPLKQEKIRPVDDNNAEETNVGGYTMLYSIAPDDDQPKPPTTGETKIKPSPIAETEKTKQLGKSPCKADSMKKSRKSSKSLTPPLKQEKIRPVDDINAEETNVGGYTMLYSIAPDDDQPKPPTTGETKIKPSPIAETEKTKQLGKSPCKADSMQKSKKSSKTRTPDSKQEKIRPVDDNNAEETNVGGYTMLYSIAPDDDQPKPPTTGETKIKSSPTVETEKTKQLRKSPCKADSMQKSRKSSKSLTPPSKQEKIRPVDDINAEETNVGGYTMLYSIAPDDDQPKPPTTGETKIKPSPIAETEKTKQLGKSPCKADSMKKSRKSSKSLTPPLKQEKIRPVDDINAEETNVGGYTMLYSIAPDDDQPKPPTTGETKIKPSPIAETEKTKQLGKSPCKADSMKKSRKSSKSLTPPLKQEKIRPVDDINAEETNVGGYTMLYSIAPDDDQPKPPTTGETKIKPSPIAETEKTKQLGKSPCKADSMQKSKKSSKTRTPDSKQEKIRPVDDNNAEETNVGGYTMLYSIAPDDDQPKPPTTGETKIKSSPTVETEKTKQLRKSPCKADSMQKSRKSSKSLTPPSKQEKIRPVDDINAEETNVGGYTMLYSIAPDDDQPKPPTTGETKIKPSPIAETEKTKQLGKSPCKADSMKKSRKSSKSLTPPLKQEKIRPVDDINAEETNVGGYTMLYSIAPDDDQPKPPTTGETKIKPSPIAETEKTKQLGKSPCKADSMKKSRKSSKSLTPPLKQEKIRPVDDINAEETNVGGYTMLYSIAPDDDQPKPPTTGETKIKPSPIAETEKTKQLGKSPCKADSMKKSRKSSKSLTPPLKQEKIRPVDDINAEETNVGGYTMLYSIAPDDDQPKPPTTGETKIKPSPIAETEKTKQLGKSPCKADSMKKSRKSSKSLTPPLKQEKIRPVDDINAEETNVGGYTMLYSIAPDDDQPKPPTTGETKIKPSPIAETEKTKQLGKSPCKADSMKKSRKSSKSLTPPLKQEKIRPVDDINAEETNVGGYTMLYSIVPDDDQPKPPATGETKIKPSPIVETGKTKQLRKSPCKADSLQKSRKSSKSLTPPLKQEKIRPVDDINAEETNVGGYTMLYSIAPDDDQPKPPTTGETKIKSSPTVETEKTKQLRKSPCKADSMQKSRKSSKSLTPPLKQEKIRPVDDNNAEETNVGGYTMLYSIAPDDDQPKPPTTGETKIKPSPIAETEKTKQLGKSPFKADSMKKSRKSSKSLTPPLKQEKIRPVDDINAEETNVGGYTMLYSIAPDDDQPKPFVPVDRKIETCQIANQVDSQGRIAKFPEKVVPTELPIMNDGNLHEVRASDQQVLYEIKTGKTNAGKYSVDKEEVVANAATGILDALAPAKLNDALECIHLEMDQKGAVAGNQIIESPHGLTVVAEPTGRRVMLMRNAERIDRTFPEWIDVSFNDKGKYKSYDLNQPLEIPMRQDGHEAYRVDSPITELGNITAMMLGRAMKFRKYLPYKIFVSPAFRCIQTCHGFLKSVEDPLLSMQIEPALFEWLGWYKTMPSWMEFSDLLKSNYKINSTYKPVVEASDMKLYLNESVVNCYQRSINAFRQILENNKKEGNILFVVHSTTIDAITRFLNGKNIGNVSQEMLKSVEKNFPYSSVLIYEELADNTWRLMPDALPSITYLDVSNSVNMDFLNRM